MTLDPIAVMEKLESLSASAIAAENEYRQARAGKYLDMAVPTDGSKKPSDEIIKAKLDIDTDLNSLRTAMDTAAAKLSAAQYSIKAAIAMAAKVEAK